MAACAKCGATLAEGATFCGNCGASVAGTPSGGTPTAGAPAPATGAGGTPASGGLTSNVAGMLAYFTIIPAILFIVMEPYNKDKFVRFHAFQSLFFNVAWIVLWIALLIVGTILAFIPVIGWAIDLLLWLAVGLGGFVLWIFLVYKAYNNERFMLPVIGKMAAQQAG